MKYLLRCVAALTLFLNTSAFSQVIAVDPLSRGLFVTHQTMTMLYERADADVTLVLVMGHPGHFGLKVGDFFVKNQTANMMRNLTYSSKLRANVVIMDSPFLLQGIGARSNSDHLGRIESVIKFYRDRLKVPVWLMGHSDGSISVSEYLNRSEASRGLVSGAVLSAGRDETRIKEDWKVPTLVIHHEKDGCDVTTFNGAKRYFSRIVEINTSVSEFAIVVGGISSGHPCSTGFHMYEGAFGEFFWFIEDFMTRQK